MPDHGYFGKHRGWSVKGGAYDFGWVMLFPRSDSEFLAQSSPIVVKLWTWLLLKANWKDRDQLKKGQLLTTIAEMREAMSHHSGWKKIVPTEDQIRSAYGSLTKAARITVRKTTRGMVVTILNYEAYNDFSLYASRPEDPTENGMGPTATPHDTESIGNQVNQKAVTPYSPPTAKAAGTLTPPPAPDKPTDPDLFEEFWAALPSRARRAGKAAARKSWDRKVKGKVDQAEVIAAVKLHAQSHDWQKDKGQFIPMITTWLNQERWTVPVESLGLAGGGAVSDRDFEEWNAARRERGYKPHTLEEYRQAMDRRREQRDFEEWNATRRGYGLKPHTLEEYHKAQEDKR